MNILDECQYSQVQRDGKSAKIPAVDSPRPGQYSAPPYIKNQKFIKSTV
jgi:hypothetical protein